MAHMLDVSDALTQILADTGWSQADFAQASGMSLVTVNRWANSKARVNERKFRRILSDLGLDAERYGLPARTTTMVSDHSTPAGFDLDRLLREDLSALREENRHQHAELLALLESIRLVVDDISSRA